MSDAIPEANQAKGFTVAREIATGRGPVSGVAMSDDGGLLALSHYGDDSVSLVDAADNAVQVIVTDIDEPAAVAVNGATAYVSSVSTVGDEILVLDAQFERIVATHPVDFGVTDLAVSVNGRFVYAGRAGVDGAAVVVLDVNTGARHSIRIDATTVARVRVSPDGRRLYAAANNSSTAALVVIDTQRHKVIGSIEIGWPIRDFAISPDGGTAYVGSCGPDFGTVLDVVDVSDIRRAAVKTTDKIGDAAGVLAMLTLSRDGRRAYLVGDQGVTVWSTATQDVLGGIAVGGQPSCAVESPDGARLYVADYAGAITELAISAALTSGDELAAPGMWTHADLSMLEPTPV